MQRADVILSLLSRKSKNDEHYVFRRLYRNLFNPDFFLCAYSKIQNKPFKLSKGVEPRKAINGINIAMVNEIIENLKFETYYPKPVSNVCSVKAHGSKRSSGTPAVEDLLVQEAVAQILEAIYEPLFLDSSYGFRPNRSYHNALHAIKSTCRGTNWLIKVDIEDFFDNVDHQVLISLLRKKIDDGRFIELIRRFLKAGYMKYNQGFHAYSGIRQGGIISRILANIYLHELDQFMEEITMNFTKGVYRERNSILNSNIKFNIDEKGRIRSSQPTHTDYVKVKYTRYANSFVICLNSSKKMTELIRYKIEYFLTNKLHLEMNMEKMPITNLKNERVKFLGYELAKADSTRKLTTNTICIKKKVMNDSIQLLVPSSVIQEKIRPFSKNGKPVHHNSRINLPLLDMIRQYNAEIRGLYNYYCLANDVNEKIGKFRFYHYMSLLKTIARKEKTSVNKVLVKYGVDVKPKQGTGTQKILGVTDGTKDGTERVITYFNEPLKKLDKPRSS